MPVSKLSDAPPSVQALAGKPGGETKIALTLSQVNWILARYDKLKSAEESGDIGSAMAIALTQFRKAFEVKAGKWAEREKVVKVTSSNPEPQGVMVAFFVPPELAPGLTLPPLRVSVPGVTVAEPQGLHMTLAYLGQKDDLALSPDDVAKVLEDFAMTRRPVKARLNGYGHFTGETGPAPVYLNVDSPDLPAFHQALVTALQKGGIEPSVDHGFTPHITLAYLPPDAPAPVLEVAPIELIFNEVHLAWGDDVRAFPLGAKTQTKDRAADKEAQKKRAEKYHIAPKKGGALTPPKGYPTAESDYLDPTNYKYPCDAEHARAALGYFNHSDAQSKGGYTDAEWKIMGQRLVKLLSRHLEGDYELKDGKAQLKPEKKTKEVSFPEAERRVRDAWRKQFGVRDDQPVLAGGPWVKEVYPTFVVVEQPDGLWKYEYTQGDDGIVFGSPVKVEAKYEPVLPQETKPTSVSIPKLLAKMFLAVLRNRGSVPVWKDKDGTKWYAAIVSSSAKDEEDEVVTTEGMDFSIRLSQEVGYRSKLYVGHGVPETRIGTCVFERRVGPLWLEIGRFRRDFWLADEVFEALRKDKGGAWKISIGFLTPLAQWRKGVYTKLLKFDTSVTDTPANPLTAIAVGGKNMDLSTIMRLLNPEDEDEKGKLEEALKELLGTASKSLTFVGKGAGGDALAQAMLKLEGLELDEESTTAVQEVLALMGQAGEAFLKKKDVGEEEPPDEEEEPVEEEPVENPNTQALEDLKVLVEAQAERLQALEGAQKDVAAQTAVLKALLKRLPSSTVQRPSTQAPEAPDDLAATLKTMADQLGQSTVGQHPLAGMMGGPVEQTPL